MNSIISGLSEEEAAERAAKGLSNGGFNVRTKSVGRIFADNIFTVFNLLNIVLAAAVALVGSFRNMLFIGVVISNTAIGIFQEIRSKRVIDKLSLISAPKARLVRGGIEITAPVSDIVVDDVMLLAGGQQICADAVVLDGECEADESLLTGESDPIAKAPGDELLSGSFVVSGSVAAKVLRVGAESASGKLTSSSKYIKKTSSDMMKSINRIISVITVCIVPFGLILFLKALFVAKQQLGGAVVNVVAALVGMIPEGLVLLTSIALAVSSIRLARRQTLCQDLYCVEALAGVDVLCLDKTGTITDGSMELEELIPLDDSFDCAGALRAFCASFDDKNPTLKAVAGKFGEDAGVSPSATIPFSSSRKYSAACFEGLGTVALGAPEFVLADSSALSPKMSEYAEQGYRVLLVAHSPLSFREKELPEALSAKALMIISDKVRDTAPQTMDFFKRQGVAVKVISGDNPVTVASTARKAGIDYWDRYVDVSALSDDELAGAAEKYTVFGRVTPFRKLALIKALKQAGHKVAMTGDGVNDVPALREADCSIAMQSGSDAARCAAQLVLLSSDLSNMPLVVEEGRRVINNIRRSSALFLVKTTYSFLLAVLFLFLPFAYPFEPIQQTLIGALTIGIPSFLLALEPNHETVRGGFLASVMARAAPGGIAVAVGVSLLTASRVMFGFGDEVVATMATLLTASVLFAVLVTVCMPFKAWRAAMLVILAAAFAGASLLFSGLFDFVAIGANGAAVLCSCIALSWASFFGLSAAAKKFAARKGL